MTQNNLYVTLFSNASRDIYEQNTHADFKVKLAQIMDLGSTSNWEVGISEISCSTFHEVANHVIIYCNLISPLFVGDSTFRCMRTFHLYISATRQHEFRNIKYVPEEQRGFQDIRIELLTTGCLHISFEDSTIPTEVVLDFRKNYQG